MKNHAMRSNEQGVSESIGFMLIFTIVIAGIALVTLYGYPLLLQQQVGAEEKIMEKNMIVLQNDHILYHDLLFSAKLLLKE